MSDPDSGLTATLHERIRNSLHQSPTAPALAPMLQTKDIERMVREPVAAMQLVSLGSYLGIFRRSLQLLRQWGRSTYPGVAWGENALPCNPANLRIMSSEDPISSYLRQRWQSQPDTNEPPRGLPDSAGRPIEIGLDQAIETFSRGLARSVATTASGMPRLIRFTVHAANSGYRVTRTEEYWYNPIVFGGSKLSTPVDDVLGPARYKFGGDLDNINIVWDNGIHQVSSRNTSTRVTAF
jgi:hypothetical protein